MERPATDLSFFEHLEELRRRLLISVIAVFICSCGFYPAVDFFLAALIKPVGRLIFTSPPEAFFARMTLTILGGCIIALPIILYQIWGFVASALTPREKGYVRIFYPLSGLCFIIGGIFAYFVMIPVSMRFLLGFSSPLMVPMITVDKYISFVLESSIDFPKKELDPQIWAKSTDDNWILRSDVKYKILSILDKYPDSNLRDMKEIHITGSICSNQYVSWLNIPMKIVIIMYFL